MQDRKGGNAELSCPNVGRWFGSCRWKARYDVGWTRQFTPPSTLAEGIGVIIDALRAKTYLGHACTRCGAWTPHQLDRHGGMGRVETQSTDPP